MNINPVSTYYIVMVFIDLHRELARIKRQEKEMEKIVRDETEKWMGEIYNEEDAKIRKERALHRLQMARISRQPKLENIIL